MEPLDDYNNVMFIKGIVTFVTRCMSVKKKKFEHAFKGK